MRKESAGVRLFQEKAIHSQRWQSTLRKLFPRPSCSTTTPFWASHYICKRNTNPPISQDDDCPYVGEWGAPLISNETVHKYVPSPSFKIV
jgi:hypothetical protein